MSTLTLAQLKNLAQQVGLSGNSADIAAAIAMAESGGNTSAHALTIYEDSWGLWQINLKAHPGYNATAMQSALPNARAMYDISSGGKNWNPWTTYTSGAYRQYLGGSNSGGSDPTLAVRPGRSNSFPMGQCTWWADQRYHDLSFYYIPWNGNAYQWLQGARSSGWQTSSTPPNGIPSIIVMQPNVQGAGGLGHVGVVEKVNKNGTVTVSNMNWNDPAAPLIKTVSGYPIRQTTIKVGAGISFVWAIGSGSNAPSSSPLDLPIAIAKTFKLAPDANVKDFLVSTDDYLALKSIFDVDLDKIQDTALGVSFTDPVKWIAEVTNNAASQTVAIAIRVILVILGLYLLLQVVRNFVDSSQAMGDAGKALPFIQSIMPGGASASGMEVAAAAL